MNIKENKNHKLSDGVVHKVPIDFRNALIVSTDALTTWENITALARNEWICWIASVKRQETRDDHIKRAVSDLKKGKRRPCCWMGCPHRTDKPMNASQKWILGKQSK